MIRIRAPFDNRDQLLPILDLATAFDDDEFGNVAYTFQTDSWQVVLSISTLDGDVALAVTIPSQTDPIVSIDLIGCEGIGVVNDKRGKFLEFVGQHKIEDFSRGKLERSAGFRLRLAPALLVEPFYHKGTDA